jgi:hypothetical protein
MTILSSREPRFSDEAHALILVTARLAIFRALV